MRCIAIVFAVTASIYLAASGPTLAQAPMSMPGHAGMQQGVAPTGLPGATPGMAANQQEMMAAMERMNRDMTAAPMTGDPDRNLVVMMMPHHQGAIDMARIYLRDGKDPAIRRMAQKIIADQEREIREFQAWLVKHPARAQ